MRTAWLLEKDVFLDQDVEARMASALVERQADFYWAQEDIHGTKSLSWIPGAKHVKESIPNPDRPLLVYGSINMARRIHWKSSFYSPRVWMDLPALSCRSYYTNLCHHMLVRDTVFTTWGLLKYNAERFFECYGVDSEFGSTIFVKPDQNLKIFSGRVVSEERFDAWYRMETDCYSVPPEELVVVSRPIPIEKEWRFFSFDGKVVTGSVYRENGKEAYAPADDDIALSAAQRVASNENCPEPAVVIDIVRSNGVYGLLELGSPNCCCLYRGDAGKFIDAASALAEKEFDDLE